MSTENLQKYLNNIKKRPEDYPVRRFTPTAVMTTELLIEQAKKNIPSTLPEDPEDAEKVQGLVSDLAKVEEFYKNLLTDTPILEFAFVRPTDDEYKELTAYTEKIFNDALKGHLQDDYDIVVSTLKASIANDAMAEMKSGGAKRITAEVRDKAVKDQLINIILANEGLTEDRAKLIDESAPEMRFTDAELEELRPAEHLIGTDAVQEQMRVSQLREDMLSAKRNGLIRRNMELIETRRESLIKQPVGELLGKIAYGRLADQARIDTQLKAFDAVLYYAVRDVKQPISRSGKLVGYKRAFDTVDDITALREADSELYGWMKEEYDKIDDFPVVNEVRELAEYEPFRNLLAFVSERTGAGETSSL